MSTHRLALVLAALGALLVLWPVRADGTRFELLVQSGAQPMAEVEARWADPVQRPWLAARPLCGVPLLAPVTYVTDSSLRRGCAGPNARSMSLGALGLLAAAGLTAAARRRPRPAPTG